MHRTLIIATATVLAAASPARADLNATYRGVDRTTGTEVPVTVQFSIGAERIAVIVKGPRSVRILFRQDPGSLRFVDDTGKSYFDIERCSQADSGMLAGIEGQLSQLTPEQRQMAEGLIQGAEETDQALPTSPYAWTKEKRSILAHECTMVNVMEGDEKVADYCACTSKDFRLNGAELAAVTAMQACLGNVFPVLGPTGGANVRALQWDTSKDGFPLLIRGFGGGSATFDVTMESFDRKKAAADLFALPSDYAKAELSAPPETETGE